MSSARLLTNGAHITTPCVHYGFARDDKLSLETSLIRNAVVENNSSSYSSRRCQLYRDGDTCCTVSNIGPEIRSCCWNYAI